MGHDRVRDTVELDDHDALLEASFVGLRGRAAREKVGAVGGEGRDGKLDGKPRAPRDSGSSDRLPPLHDFRL